MEKTSRLTEEADDRRRKTVLKTFRFSEELLHSLEKEAAEEGTTINAFCATLLTKHAEWGYLARKVGMVSVSKRGSRS